MENVLGRLSSNMTSFLVFPFPFPSPPPAGGRELRFILYLYLGLPQRIPESAPGHHGAWGAPRVGGKPGLKWHRMWDVFFESQRMFPRLTQSYESMREVSQNIWLGFDL